MTDEEKEAIVEELETLTAIRSISTKLAIEAEQYTAKVEIPQKYKRHARVFSEEESQRFPPSRTWDHTINLKPGSPDSLNCKIYPTTPVEKVALKEWISKMEGKKYIRRCDPNKAYIMSSFFFINKKDGKRRPVQDYRPVNKMTERDYYPLVTIKRVYFIFRLLFITCTITVGHMTDTSSLSHMTHYESFLGLHFSYDSL
jgi:hypothetical protein